MTKTIPAGQIEWIVDRLHVGAPDDIVAADIRRRCTAEGWTEALIARAIKLALARHHANQQTVRDLHL